ncbi:MAG: hypothetical protein J4G19_03230 [Pseudomonadales bacterium]|nr:hypothetical protein [Pseudomonadales bacterium]
MHETQPVHYMERTRLYYEAQGFERAYQWAHFEDVPFTPLEKSLSDSRVAVITTGSRYDRLLTDPRFVDSGEIDELPSHLFAKDLAWDKQATHLNDLGSYLPAQVLKEFANLGTIGSVAPRFHCLPTEYSQRRTRETDAPEILRRCREDQADVALLVPL